MSLRERLGDGAFQLALGVNLGLSHGGGEFLLGLFKRHTLRESFGDCLFQLTLGFELNLSHGGDEFRLGLLSHLHRRFKLGNESELFGFDGGDLRVPVRSLRLLDGDSLLELRDFRKHQRFLRLVQTLRGAKFG